MFSELEILDALRQTDFGPIKLEIEQREVATTGTKKVDAFVVLWWGSESKKFVAEVKKARSMRDIRNSVWQLGLHKDQTGRNPLLIVPYLTDAALKYLKEEKVSALDLSGNGIIEVGETWRFYQRGFKNKYRTNLRSKDPYRGKSGLVGRLFLSKPTFTSVGEIKDEIENRGGRLSMSQVSKVLKAMEEDLVIRRSVEEITLIQPQKLLDQLVEGYTKPKSLKTLKANETLNQKLFDKLNNRAKAAGARIVAYDARRYVVAPESRDYLLLYVNTLQADDLADIFQVSPVDRFENIVIQSVNDSPFFFNTDRDNDFNWCSKLETYLRLTNGGKRERESAEQLREEILQGTVKTVD